MSDFFTIETVRDQLLQAGTLKISFDGGTFPKDWQYCPCIIVENCTRLNNKKCSTPIYIGVFIRTPNISIPIVVEIIYERETHRGFIRANNMKLNALIDKGIINERALRRVVLPF
jgi:hypothetical protein